MISGENCFAIWAPEGVPWSAWAKPVLFASAGTLPTDNQLLIPELFAPGLTEIPGNAAFVLDLPGARAVTAGLAVAARGFRPVPLFNGTEGPSAVVAVKDLVAALGAGSLRLKEMAIQRDAPPAFLLDSDRKGLFTNPPEGSYDNRWVVLPQDLPSATFLRSHGILEVVLVQSDRLVPATDLSHVLLRWQKGGLRLRAIDLDGGRTEANLQVSEPSLFRYAWYGAVALMGLRRSNVGGFGSPVPEQSSGSGFYG
jgi:hypothetical protein